eukprot:CAMPEP_0185206404 /NCGR_PEP_ID=MMETSP1140-20130426/58387_1 /TAXON_ID=298111 /ORGANISM="Pavlova sp., Strain CCMP459" /LENGTH=82 /DNA_ID=CAMNT_0027774043 /DNA_START=214 /DNA_END=458 /DNA_ORIENTATION=+
MIMESSSARLRRPHPGLDETAEVALRALESIIERSMRKWSGRGREMRSAMTFAGASLLTDGRLWGLKCSTPKRTREASAAES